MKRQLYDIIAELPKPVQKLIVDLSDFVKNPKLILENRKQIREFFHSDHILEIGQNKMNDTDKKIWEKGLLYYALSSPRAARKIADNFCKCRLEVIKEDTTTWTKMSPVYICVVKDDLARIQMSYEHHKKIGVTNFVFIDNGSSDGTLEWLQNQPVVVYQTLDPFIMWAKVAWVSKVINHFGFDRWYLILDSDELFAYAGCEDDLIGEYIAQLERKGIEKDFSFMLDMYNDEVLFENKNSEMSIQERFCYFDADSYELQNCLHYKKVIGGPRQRVFASKDTMEMLQNKYPLVYYKKGDIYRYHYVSPYFDNFSKKCTSALLHYKFLDGDYEKYKKIAQDGNYANGSRLYKEMLQKLENEAELIFYNRKSIKYQNSKDLLKNKLISDWK